ncbi:MAG: hypothetical protein GX130_10505 [Candidatus Hydrogenedens sp.]|nr:hypothetical protein [Candidatus Hydrogenedens sp.]
MKQNFVISWNNGQLEKSIRYDFSIDPSSHTLKADVTLSGETEITYQSQLSYYTKDFSTSAVNTDLVSMTLVATSLKNIISLPVVDDIDPDIIDTAEAFTTALANMKNGVVDWSSQYNPVQNQADEWLDISL